MQKGMTQELHKDILADANRQTKARFARQNSELTEFMDAIEHWLVSTEEEGERTPGEHTNGRVKRGGRPI